MGLGCGAKVGKIVLVVVNTIFLLLGLAIAIAGLVFKFGDGILKEDIRGIFQKIHVDMVGGIDVYSLINNLSNVFIAVGFIVFLLGFLGCFGACCENKVMLVLYAILVMLILIAQLAGVALIAAFKSNVEGAFRTGLEQEFQKDYKNNATEFNALFKTFQCCGIDSAKDVTNATGRPLPAECCASQPCTLANAYEGCYTKLESYINRYAAAFIGVGVGILIFQFLCIVFAFCLCCAIGRDD